MKTKSTRTNSTEEREQLEAAEAFHRRKMIRQAYRQVIADGGALAEALSTPERLTPGSAGFNAQQAWRRREQRRQKHRGLQLADLPEV